MAVSRKQTEVNKNTEQTRKVTGRGNHPNSRMTLKTNAFTSEHQPERNGRPKGSKDRSTVVKKWLEVLIDFKNPTTKQTEKMSVEDAMALSMISQVIAKGNVAAYNSLKDELYGKLKEKVEQSYDLSNLTDDELKALAVITSKLT